MKNLFRVDDRSILVTGASGSIGSAVCRSVAEFGGKVIGSGRDGKRLSETARSVSGDNHSWITADLLSASQRYGLVDGLPLLDGFVFAAGMNQLKPMQYVEQDYLNRLQSLNYEVPLLLTAALLKARKFRSGASLVYIASIAGMIGTVGNAVYAGSKGGLISSLRCLALELAGRRIRVNSVAPGRVQSRLSDAIREQLSPDAMKRDESLYPLGYGEPDDVAGAAVYLLSKAARWVTGTTLIVDGGYTCK